MINKNTAFRSLLFGGIFLSGFMFGACQIIPNNNMPNNTLPTPVIDEEDETTPVEDEGVSIVRNSDIVITDISDKDYAIVDYVNTHSDYVFILLGEMKNGEVMQDVGDLYGEASKDSLVKSYAENLEEYCLKFCSDWLWNSPDAEKYRFGIGGCYTEADFIEYLNTYSFPDHESIMIKDLGWTDLGKNLPEEYKDCPYFNF